MNLEESIKEILFQIGKDIKIHKVIDGNFIVEIDYDKYTEAILNLLDQKSSGI